MGLEKTGPLNQADKIVIMLHGRGATAKGILQLSEKLPEACYMAPQAPGNTWYPESFLKPRHENQPFLEESLETVNRTVEKASQHVGKDSIALLGFSQGACLASENVAENAEKRKLGGLIVFSGGLIGETVDTFTGDLQNMRVFIGCSEEDPHIPMERIEETAEVFSQLNAEVDKYTMKGSFHGIDEKEVEKASEIIQGL